MGNKKLAPLEHYQIIGWKQGLSPIPLFNVGWYLENNPDLVEAGIEPLRHYLKWGWRENRSPSQYFDAIWYLQTYKVIAKAKIDPLTHYLKYGWKENRNPNPYFDVAWYLQVNQDIDNRETEPLSHYLESGWKEKRNPNRHFDVGWYLLYYPDVAEAGAEPLRHYLEKGWREMRNPNAYFDNTCYLELNPNVNHLDRDPFTYFLETLSPLGWLADTGNTYQHTHEDNPIRKARFDVSAAVPRKPYIVSPLNISLRLTEHLRWNRYVISLSQDPYLKQIGGVQLLISDEQLRCNTDQIDYIHICPLNESPIFIKNDEPFYVQITCNGISLGEYEGNDLIAFFTKFKANHLEKIIIHHLKGFNIHWVYRLLAEIGEQKIVYWIHDYFSICPKYNLLRNQMQFCHAPDILSDSCQTCISGEERCTHIPYFRTLFNTFAMEIYSPSEYAFSLWKQALDFPVKTVHVVPHAKLRWEPERRIQEQSHDFYRIAFIGFPYIAKGWQTFIKVVDTFSKDNRYKFFHFSSKAGTFGNYQRIPVSVTPNNRFAMRQALVEHNIDVALLWSIFPETFSYTLYEALAAGCFVLTSQDSGNIQDFIKKNQDRGLVLRDENALLDLLSSDSLIKSVNTYQEEGRPQAEIIFSSGVFTPPSN
ncbi:MAG TPA: hypothetical protein VIO61_02865 [Anaerolineaceae bacterium]